VIRNDAQQKIDETLTCRAHPLPIFVISYNRGDTLSRVVDSYRKQARPVEIIIHEMAATISRRSLYWTSSPEAELRCTGARP
jgi:hypothetical protein